MGPSSDVWYSIPELNTTDPLMLKNLLLFNDPSRQQILFTLEDQGSDEDCNDNVFYITINPSMQGVNTTNMPVLATIVVDSDHDGVPDASDDYPNDPTRAFNNFTPSLLSTETATMRYIFPTIPRPTKSMALISSWPMTIVLLPRAVIIKRQTTFPRL